MDPADREFHISRILSPCQRFKIAGTTYILVAPTLDDRYLANLSYKQTISRCRRHGVLSIEELLRIGYWTQEDEKKYQQIPEDISQFKEQIFLKDLNESEQKNYRGLLRQARQMLAELHQRRHQYDSYSSEGIAYLAKQHKLISLTIRRRGRKFRASGGLIANIFHHYNSSFLTEGQYRELARTSPFRDLWSLGKVKLLGKSVSSLTDEQRILLSWAKIYDNVYAAHNPPPESVISDDDALDGWFIHTRKLRETEDAKRRRDEFDARHPNSEEVFVPVGSKSDAKKVDAMNETYGNIVKRQRFNALRQSETGIVEHFDMPDVQQKLAMEVTQKQH